MSNSIFSSAGKPKVLCLHGFQSSGKSLLKQMAAITAAIPECEFVAPPHAGAWWRASDDGTLYDGWEDSVKLISRVFAEDGPFDGARAEACFAMPLSHGCFCSVSPLRSQVCWASAKEQASPLCSALCSNQVLI